VLVSDIFSLPEQKLIWLNVFSADGAVLQMSLNNDSAVPGLHFPPAIPGGISTTTAPWEGDILTFFFQQIRQ
jgi:hypothetical protein